MTKDELERRNAELIDQLQKAVKEFQRMATELLLNSHTKK